MTFTELDLNTSGDQGQKNKIIQRYRLWSIENPQINSIRSIYDIRT